MLGLSVYFYFFRFIEKESSQENKQPKANQPKVNKPEANQLKANQPIN